MKTLIDNSITHTARFIAKTIWVRSQPSLHHYIISWVQEASLGNPEVTPVSPAWITGNLYVSKKNSGESSVEAFLFEPVKKHRCGNIVKNQTSLLWRVWQLETLQTTHFPMPKWQWNEYEDQNGQFDVRKNHRLEYINSWYTVTQNWDSKRGRTQKERTLRKKGRIWKWKKCPWSVLIVVYLNKILKYHQLSVLAVNKMKNHHRSYTKHRNIIAAIDTTNKMS